MVASYGDMALKRYRTRLLILEQWCGPDDAYFKVKVGDGGVYTLRRSLASPDGAWAPEETGRDAGQWVWGIGVRLHT